jgi:hypothetical protein
MAGTVAPVERCVFVAMILAELAYLWWKLFPASVA